MYRHGHTDKALSDAGRWVSLQLGWEVFREQPWMGVGVGNLKQAVHQRYAVQYPDLPYEARKMPHNQFLSMFAAGGILGGIVFTLLFFYPLFHGNNYQYWLLLGLYVIMGLSFLVENTIENAMGLGFFVYYLLHLLLRFTTAEQPIASDGVEKEAPV
jgi:O-antigen ligase